jgi:hypothetical protein
MPCGDWNRQLKTGLSEIAVKTGGSGRRCLQHHPRFFVPVYPWQALGCRSGLGQIKPVGVHHFGPGGDEILHEAGLGVGAGVNLGQGAQL